VEKWVWLVNNASYFPFMALSAGKVKPNWGKLFEYGLLIGLAYIAAYSNLTALQSELKEFKSTVTIEMKEIKTELKEFRKDFYRPMVGE